MNRLVLGVALALATSAATAQQREWTTASRPGDGSVFSFRGHQVGDPLSKHRKSYMQGGKLDCRQTSDDPLQKTCNDRALPVVHGYRELSGLTVQHLWYEYYDDKFAGFYLCVHTEAYPRLRAMLIERYGQPSATAQQPVQNRFSAVFDNEVTVWRTPHGPVALSQRSDRVDQADLYFFDQATAATIRERQQLRPREQGKKAF